MANKSDAGKQVKETVKVKEEPMDDEPVEVLEEASKEKESKEKESKEDESKEEESKEETPAKENGEEPLPKKRVVLQPVVASLKESFDHLVELTNPEIDDDDDVKEICSEARKVKQLLEDLISMAMRPVKRKAYEDPAQFQYVAKVRGLQPHNFKDMRSMLQNALGLRTVKLSTAVRNSPFVDIHFMSEELMEKGVKILRNKPLGLTLSVVETKKVDKSRVPPDCLISSEDLQYDPTVMLKESLQRCKELTEEEYNKMVEWKENYIKHMLLKMCERLDHDVLTVVKDRTEGYFYKLEKMRAEGLSDSESERFQTYSGLDTEDDKVKMGFWVLGSDIPSRIPRSQAIRKTLKVITDFMESSEKPFYDLRVRKGFWNSVMIRSNHLSQCMVVLIVNCEKEADVAKDCEALKPQLAELFETGEGKDCQVKSVNLKSLNESGKSGAVHVLYGEEYLEEEVSGLKLRLFINTLFWSDGSCSGQLCQTIVDELGLDQESGLLELGVSTGLICLSLAKHCKVVCGLDRVQSVLPTATKNLELNELKNVVLVQGTPTTSLASLKTHFKDCGAVHALVLETTSNTRNKDEIFNMRKAAWIKKVAYLIVSYKDVTTTLRMMCNKSIGGGSDPFVITKVIPFENASTSVRPDILVILDRASALGDVTETRVPTTKFKPYQSGGPPSKRLKTSPGPYSGSPRGRSLMGRRFGPPMHDSMMSGGRGYQHNIGYGSQRGPMFPWQQQNVANRYRMEEEEAMLMERARREKEAQLQQMQEVVLEAQRRRIADALLPTPPMPNIEEVVLSAIKKTGLLERVAALGETPASRYNEPEPANDRWSSDYQRASVSGSRSAFNDNSYQNDSSHYQDSSYGYQRRDNSSSGYQRRDTMSGYQGRDSSTYRGRGVGGNTTYKSRGSYY